MEKSAAFELLFVGALRQVNDRSTIELRHPVVFYKLNNKHNTLIKLFLCSE